MSRYSIVKVIDEMVESVVFSMNMVSLLARRVFSYPQNLTAPTGETRVSVLVWAVAAGCSVVWIGLSFLRVVTTLSAFVAAERVSATASAEVNCLAFISVGWGIGSEITWVLGIVWHRPFLQESVEVAWSLVAVSYAASYHIWQESPGIYFNAFADSFHCHMAVVNDMKYEWTRGGEGRVVLARWVFPYRKEPSVMR